MNITPANISILQKFESIHEYWSPAVVGELNGQAVKLVKIKGEFTWHHHETEDELFYVVRGSFEMQFREKNVLLREGECIIVPAGVEHRPVASEEAWVMLFEPASTLNTGNTRNEFTKEELPRI
ncbi:MAG TPA: cupin domain-containing protein [Chitinophagaceae bacterium]